MKLHILRQRDHLVVGAGVGIVRKHNRHVRHCVRRDDGAAAAAAAAPVDEHPRGNGAPDAAGPDAASGANCRGAATARSTATREVRIAHAGHHANRHAEPNGAVRRNNEVLGEHEWLVFGGVLSDGEVV